MNRYQISHSQESEFVPPYKFVQETSHIRALKRYFLAIYQQKIRVRPAGNDNFFVFVGRVKYCYEVKQVES